MTIIKSKLKKKLKRIDTKKNNEAISDLLKLNDSRTKRINKPFCLNPPIDYLKPKCLSCCKSLWTGPQTELGCTEVFLFEMLFKG